MEFISFSSAFRRETFLVVEWVSNGFASWHGFVGDITSSSRYIFVHGINFVVRLFRRETNGYSYYKDFVERLVLT